MQYPTHPTPSPHRKTTPKRGIHCCSPSCLPATPLSRNLEVLYELILLPSRALNLELWVASETTEKQGHCQMCHTQCRGPRTLSKTNDANLDCEYAKNTLFTLIVIDCKKPRESDWVSDPTWATGSRYWVRTSKLFTRHVQTDRRRIWKQKRCEIVLVVTSVSVCYRLSREDYHIAWLTIITV